MSSDIITKEMKKKIFKILTAVAVTAFLAGFNAVYAVGEDFTVEIFPESPGPNERVSAEIVSYSFDVNRSSISWIIDGTAKLSGRGEKKFSFSTGNSGSKTTLKVSIVTEKGVPMEKTFTFRPAGLDILWETDTYTPPFYKGKALLSQESTIKITAFPEFIYNGEKISPSDLVYDWEINSKKRTDMSGYGKRTISYKLSSFSREEDIKVTVSSYSKIIIAEKRIKIETIPPKIIFYQENPLEGAQYNKALEKETDLYGGEISVRAESYFFSNSNLSQLSYQWKMNGNSIETEGRKNIIDFRTGEGIIGSALVDLVVQNPINILQSASSNFRINFGL